ncbi:hypothetical protein BGW38_010048 [Lunasporangiospora selenospora]|uniref:Alpha-N-acetylglucosaminidase n=1 Tax=Lunasporangiospora selenospora TaxID=979761 RepID=A0A9P6KIF0_9FUNG|nr:hypothetical protein BGW38_010048 [Lunasporangiospora selenospora]
MTAVLILALVAVVSTAFASPIPAEPAPQLLRISQLSSGHQSSPLSFVLPLSASSSQAWPHSHPALDSTLSMPLTAISPDSHSENIPETSSSGLRLDKRQAPIASAEPLYALIKRLLPAPYHEAFTFQLIPGLTSPSATHVHDTFRLSNSNNTKARITIESSTVSGLGAGLSYYLKQVCHVEMTWSGDRFNELPSEPPALPESLAGPDGVMQASFVPWRYYMNVVTYGYSFAFWDWTRWERELDWMMLSGVNMALSMIGQEYVLRQMYESMGLSREQLNGFFSGPAFMPWQRMGNIQGMWWANNPNHTQFNNDWIDSQWELQQKIMQRMHEFNITAIMPAFNGFVPKDLPKIFPDAKFSKSSGWIGFAEDYTGLTYIQPTEPLFANITKQFIQLQKTLYTQGSPSSYFLLDLYNELRPSCTTEECLRAVTKNVMTSLKAADPEAIWVMQGWFLVTREIWKPPQTKAFFDGIREVNEGRDAFVIDLFSDVIPIWKDTDAYFGIDWGWSMLNNFGGGQGLYGTLPTLLTEPLDGFKRYPKTMRGMGITMEGINNNEFLYQIILDIPWQTVSSNPATHELQPINGQDRLDAYIKRRYGPAQTSSSVLQAWTTLGQTVWDCRTKQMSQSKSYVEGIPTFNMTRPGFMTTMFWYDQNKVVDSWRLLVQSTETEASKARRGGSVIQNSVKEVLLVTSGAKPFASKRSVMVASTKKVFWDTVRKTSAQVQSTSSSLFAIKRDDATPQTLPKESELPLNVSSFRYDLVDVTREVMLAVVLPGLHRELIDAYVAKDKARVRSMGDLVLDSILDTDRILSTHTHFMLGSWINEARVSAKVVAGNSNSAAYMSEYADYLEHNSRNQVTWWGPKGQKVLADYGSKQWGGLMKEYHYQRWKLFVDGLKKAVNSGSDLEYTKYLDDVLAMETIWQKEVVTSAPEKYPFAPVEKTADVAQDLWDRWGQAAIRLARNSGTPNNSPMSNDFLLHLFTLLYFSDRNPCK